MEDEHKSRTANVSVFVRIKPPEASDGGSTAWMTLDERDSTLTVKQPAKAVGTATNTTRSQKGASWTFNVNSILNARVTQEEVFNSSARDMVNNLLQGYNGTVMAYGQTGAGKTYTMTGPPNGTYKQRGLIARTLHCLFGALDTGTASGVTVRVSHVEIYNEQVFDLLAFNEDAPADLGVYETKDGQTQIRGLSQPVVANEDEALGLLFQGETNRAIAEHQLNKASTRSHVVFTLHLERRGGDHEEIISSKLNLVDLAGSERTGKTGSTGSTFKEATHINKSLTFLEQVVVALVDKKRDHIPYRQTKLTNVLKDSLGGNCRTRLIACVWPTHTHYEETLATLRFATRMMRVRTKPTINFVKGRGVGGAAAARYEAEIRHLRRELALHDALADRTGVRHEPLSDHQVAAVRHSVTRFLGGMEKDMEVRSLRQALLAFRMCRSLLVQSQNGVALGFEASEYMAPIPAATSAAAMAIPDDDPSTDVLTVERRRPAGDTALKMAAQASMVSTGAAGGGGGAGAGSGGGGGAGGASTGAGGAGGGDAGAEAVRQEMFAMWKTGEGKELSDRLVATKATLRQKKKQCKELVRTVNNAKAEIDTAMKMLKTSNGEDVVALEYAAKLKSSKKAYRAAYEQVTEGKAEVKYLIKSVEGMKAELLAAFDAWRRENQ